MGIKLSRVQTGLNTQPPLCSFPFHHRLMGKPETTFQCPEVCYASHVLRHSENQNG